MPRLARFAWAVLGYILLVVVWGAFVRASGSGAGCGSHWPLCNGVVVPRDPGAATLVELAHRITSGLALVLVIVLLVWASAPPGAEARSGSAPCCRSSSSCWRPRSAPASCSWRRSGEDSSLARAVWLAGHLVNTFILLTCLTLTAWWASGGSPIRVRGVKRSAWVAGALLAGMLVVGVTGAVTALGDTLFPAPSLAQGFRQDLSPAAHFLIKLRVLHPALRGSTRARPADGDTGAGGPGPGGADASTQLGELAKALGALVLLQWAAGIANVLLLAPIWLQLVHLLLADLLWITLVLLTARALADRRRDRKGFRTGLGRDLMASGSGR